MFKNENVLVAGGTGTIGIPLVRRLVDLGAKVTVVSLEAESQARRLIGDEPRFIQSDLTRFEACEQVTRDQRHVFNLVGIKGSIGIGETKAASYLVPMLRFQTNLMDAAFRNGVRRFLFVSSICAYPQGEMHAEGDLWNGMPKQNDRFAGIAKRVGELQAEAYLCEYGWDAVRIVRPSSIYGPWDDFNPATAQVVPSLIRKMLDCPEHVEVWGDGSAIRDFIYVDDVVDGILLAMSFAPACTPINLGSGKGVSIRELAEIVASLVPIRPKIFWSEAKPTGDPVRRLDVQRARDLLAFHAKTSLTEGVSKTITWYQHNVQLANMKVSALDVSA